MPEILDHMSSPDGCHEDCPACKAEKFQCQNCEARWQEGELKEVKDVWERVAPGELLPAGECPDCGAVCHEVNDEDDELTVAVKDLIRDYPRMGYGVGEHIERLREIVGMDDEDEEDEEDDDGEN